MKLTPLFHLYVQRLLFDLESGLFVIFFLSTGGPYTNNIPINLIVVVFFEIALPQYYYDVPPIESVTHALTSSSADI